MQLVYAHLLQDSLHYVHMTSHSCSMLCNSCTRLPCVAPPLPSAQMPPFTLTLVICVLKTRTDDAQQIIMNFLYNSEP